jgi:hypothetical protein
VERSTKIVLDLDRQIPITFILPQCAITVKKARAKRRHVHLVVTLPLQTPRQVCVSQ